MLGFLDLTKPSNQPKFVEEVDRNEKKFGNYEEAKTKITIDLKISTLDRKRNKMMKNLENKYMQGGEQNVPF